MALVEHGIPKFSETPVRHLSKGGAKLEAERLAALHPGKLFQVFGAASIATERPGRGGFQVEQLTAYVEPYTTFTGRGVRESAPEGEYHCREAGIYAKVLTASGTRAVLFSTGRCRPRRYEDALGDVWDDNVFTPVLA